MDRSMVPGRSAAGGRKTGPVRKWLLALAGGLLVPAFLVAGPAGLLAWAVLVCTADQLVHRAVAARRRRTDLVDVVAALRMYGRELRSGVDPGTAAARVAGAARGVGADILAALAQSIGVGDRASDLPDSRPAASGRVAPGPYALTRLTQGWRLTARYGVALAPVVEALATDLAEQITADAGRAGQVAGPRTSGYVMAALPILGLALGSGMGAAPVQVLLDSSVGNILLAAGVTLTCVGLLWSARIVGR